MISINCECVSCVIVFSLVLIDTSSVLEDLSSEENVVFSLGQTQLQRLTCSLLYGSGYDELKMEDTSPEISQHCWLTPAKHTHKYTHS